MKSFPSSWRAQGPDESDEAFQARLLDVVELRAEIKFLQLTYDNAMTTLAELTKERDAFEREVKELRKEVADLKEENEELSAENLAYWRKEQRKRARA